MVSDKLITQKRGWSNILSGRERQEVYEGRTIPFG